MDPRLQQIETEGKLWRKYCEDEERRIDEEYERRLAEIDAEFEEAAKKIRQKFSQKMDAVKRQFSDGHSLRKPSAQLACTTEQQSSAPIPARRTSARHSNSIAASVEVHNNDILSSQVVPSAVPHAVKTVSSGQNEVCHVENTA